MLSFDDLMSDVEQEVEEKGLPFKCKDGKITLLRPVLLLGGAELKNVLALLPKLADEKVDVHDKLEYAAAILIAAADNKVSLRKSLDALPPTKYLDIVSEWTEKAGTDLPES